MSSAPTPEEIARDAHWLAQAVDPVAGEVRFIAMDRDSYRTASFLDDRLLQHPVHAQIIAWPQVETAVRAIPRNDARWIFHIGHVGSTLVSRLLGELDGVLAVREPRLLRDIALTPPDAAACYVEAAQRLLSRTFGATEVACVKATSFVSEIAPRLVPPRERALFMFATPRNYVASILAGENSVKELRMLADSREARLRARGLAFGRGQNDAELAAQAWACEMTALERAAEQMSNRGLLWADFDSMLGNMALALREIVNHFGFTASDETLQEIASGPLMNSYSKALEYEYSADLRRELIAEARRYHEPEIDAALAMLSSASDKSPLLARALLRAEAKD